MTQKHTHSKYNSAFNSFTMADGLERRESAHGEMAEGMALFTGVFVSAKPI